MFPLYHRFETGGETLVHNLIQKTGNSFLHLADDAFFHIFIGVLNLALIATALAIIKVKQVLARNFLALTAYIMILIVVPEVITFPTFLAEGIALSLTRFRNIIVISCEVSVDHVLFLIVPLPPCSRS